MGSSSSVLQNVSVPATSVSSATNQSSRLTVPKILASATDYTELIDRNANTPLLFGIPVEITAGILSEWLDWNSLSYLDVALCSPKELADILAPCRETSSTTPRIKDGMSDLYLAWASARRFQSNHLCIEPSLYKGIEYLAETPRNVRSLWLMGRPQARKWEIFVSPFVNTLVELRLHRCSLSSLHELVQSCPMLSRLTLVSCCARWSMRGDGYPQLRELKFLGTTNSRVWSATCHVPLPNLSHLYLSGFNFANSSVSTRAVVQTAVRGGNLTFLALDSCIGVNIILPSIASMSLGIAQLRLANCDQIKDSTLCSALYACRSIQTLKLTHQTSSPPNALNLIAELCSATLTHLDISHSAFSPSEDMAVALAQLTRLKVLSLTGYYFNTPLESAWPERLPCLKHLELQCAPVSDVAIQRLVGVAPQLRVLTISCPERVGNSIEARPRYTAAGVQTALKSLPELRQLGIDLPVQREWVTAYPRVKIEEFVEFS